MEAVLLFQVAIQIPGLEMTIVTVIHLVVKLSSTFVLLQLTANY